MAISAHSLTGTTESTGIVGLPKVAIEKSGKIVGQYGGGVPEIGVTVSAPPTGSAGLPAQLLLLSGCDEGDVATHPDVGRTPLPPGRYQLVAVVSGNGIDLVSLPSTIEITQHP